MHEPAQPLPFRVAVRALPGAMAALRPVSAMTGRVLSASASGADIAGLAAILGLGARCGVEAAGAAPVPACIVASREGTARVALYQSAPGLAPGAAVSAALTPHCAQDAAIYPSPAWLGRIIDPLCTPIDGGPPLPPGDVACPVRAAPPPSVQRARLGSRLDTRVAVVDLFATCRQGQRLGLFAGSGVGKSTLLAMLARGAACDVVVLAFVGERGREVREFLEDDLGPGAMARCVAVAATSDETPLMRREAAWTAMAIAEYFCAQGRSVLLLMDSLTRFCLAQREIGLAAGEPPALRGYTPSVFAELARLLERAGPGVPGTGSISAWFTVLVEGDDHNEPVADAARGILDGHILLDRAIAERGRFPAVNILRSLSRTASSVLTAGEGALVRKARSVLATHAEAADLIRLGAYKRGSDPAVDQAIALAPRIEALVNQPKDAPGSLADSFAALHAILEPASDV